MTKRAFRGLFWGAVALALVFRTVRLDWRPMHHDEANQAVKFGTLLERGEYRYDPDDHHGPSLYYLTLPVAMAAGDRSLAALDETALRVVPALFGTGILLLFLLFAGGLGRESVVFAGFLTAISPAMTYFSRFYIQEMLLVFFLAALLACGWQYARTRSGWWAAAAGLAAGMMYATKETSVLLFGTAAVSLLAVRLTGGPKAGREEGPPAGNPGQGRRNVRGLGRALHGFVFLAAAGAVAVLLFTSFLKNPSGLADSIRAFGSYFSRAGAGGAHVHPWYEYLRLLGYFRIGHGPVWSEAFVLALAAAGGIAAFSHDAAKDGAGHFARFLFFFTVLTAAVYSAIPYKTPWNALPFYLGVLLLAGSGAGLLWRISRFLVVRAIVLAMLLPGFANLAYQDYRANFVDETNPGNPYVYAQTGQDFLRLVQTVEGIARISPEKERILIKVVAPPDETWPLPWSLRRFGRVGYWTEPGTAGVLRDAPVVIASAAYAETVGAALGDGYQSGFYGLRPEVLLSLFVRRDLWELYLRAETCP